MRWLQPQRAKLCQDTLCAYGSAACPTACACVRARVQTTVKAPKEEGNKLGPMVIGFFLFVVVGSSLFQIIRTAQSGRAF
jgi:hypothetical protein